MDSTVAQAIGKYNVQWTVEPPGPRTFKWYPDIEKAIVVVWKDQWMRATAESRAYSAAFVRE